MFDEKTGITKAVDALYDFMATLRRGDVLTHNQIADIIGGSPHEGSWDHIVNRARKRLLNERGIALMAEPSVGYLLLRPGDQIRCLLERCQKASRQILWGMKEVAAIPKVELTNNQRLLRAAALEIGAETRRNVQKGLTGQKTLTRPCQPMPRPPLPA